MSKRMRLGEFGDTIVEVMLAVAIVSSVLGAAFVSVQKSLGGARQSQERGEAMKLLEGQIEKLKEAAVSPGSSVFTTTGDFCMNNSYTVVPSTSAECGQGTENRYKLSITRSGNTFTSQAVWDKVGGGGQDRAQFIYRIYEQ